MNTNIVRLSAVGLFALTLLQSCKSDDHDPAEGAELKAAAEVQVKLPVLNLDGASKQSLYLKLLAAELSAGAKVPKDQVHAVSGVVECRRDGDLDSCAAHVRLPTEELSTAQPLDEALTDHVFAFLRGARPDAESFALGDVDCDYLGKSSPPYGVEDVQCRVSLPRAPGEAVFDGRIAEELSELARAGSEFGKGKANVGGAVTCHTIAVSNRRVCMVRGGAGDTLKEGVSEVSARHAPTVAKRLMQAAIDHIALARKKPAGELVAPKDVTRALACTVDGAKLESDGIRAYVCLARP